jgi:hypothetical protein
MTIASSRDRAAVFAIAIAVAALAASAPALAQGKDDLWEVTMKMEMPGMPMAMPPQVHRVCVAKAHKDEDLIPTRGNCRVLDSRRTGNKVSYRMSCTGDEPMEVSGETTYGSDTSYEGRMRMTSTSAGQSMEMAQTYSGKRVGGCVAAR